MQNADNSNHNDISNNKHNNDNKDAMNSDEV